MAKKKAVVEATDGFQLSTEMFKELVAKAFKGVGNNKLLSLTQLMCIEAKDGKLRIITTDSTGSDYLYLIKDGVPGEFYATVMAEQFAKLIGKLTCDKVTLFIDSDKLKVKGNGDYVIPLQYDEMGNAIQFPDPVAELGDATEDTQTVNSNVVNIVMNSIKPALATTFETPYLTGYYVGDKILATDGYVMACYDAKMLDTPAILQPTVFDMLALSDAENISIDRYEDGVIVFSTPDLVLYSHEMDGVDEYPVAQLTAFIEEDMESECKLPKTALLQALDRLSLFVGTYDDNEVKLNFSEKALNLASVASTGVEDIGYTSGTEADVFSCGTDLLQLIRHIKTQSTDTVTIQYGEPNAIKLIDGKIIQIVDLMNADTEE